MPNRGDHAKGDDHPPRRSGTGLAGNWP